MPADVRDVLNANIVLVGIGLLNNPTEVSAFSELVDSEVISTGAGLVVSLPQGMPGPGQRLELPRERIFLNLTPIRIDIGRHYPTERGDLGRLAHVIACAVASTDLQGQLPTAIGYNLEVVYNQTSGEPSLSYLGSRLVNSKISGAPDWNLAGGAGLLVFDSPAGRWTIKVEPRFNQEDTTQVFMSLNLHKAEQRVPD